MVLKIVEIEIFLGVFFEKLIRRKNYRDGGGEED